MKTENIHIRFIEYRAGVGRVHAGMKMNLQYRVFGLFWVKLKAFRHHGINIPLAHDDKEEMIRILLDVKKLSKDKIQVIEHAPLAYH